MHFMSDNTGPAHPRVMEALARANAGYASPYGSPSPRRQITRRLTAAAVADVDHRNLNTEVPWLAGIIPSTENLAVAVWDRIAPELPDGVRLASVVIRETRNNSVEYRGEDRG